jgi:hypothetical protein
MKPRVNLITGTVIIVGLLSLLSLLAGQLSPLAATNRNIIGLKIYQEPDRAAQSFDLWKKLGINTLFVGPELAGKSDWLKLCRQAGFKIFLIIPVFHNPEKLKDWPGMAAMTGEGLPAKDDWLEFVCPGNQLYRQELIESVKKMVSELKPDGLSLDFIRHFVFWEKVYPESTLDILKTTCFCPECIKNFQKETGIIIPPAIQGYPDIPRWLVANHRTEWTAWRNRQITTMVEDVSRAARQVDHFLQLNLHLVPWREDDFNGGRISVAGQDLKSLSRYVDYLSPMTYAPMLKRPPEWISSVVADIQSTAPNPILPSVQVKEAYLPEELSLEEFEAELKAALKPPAAGVIFWNWETLAGSKEKQKIIQKQVSEFIHNQETLRLERLEKNSLVRAGLRASPYGPKPTFPGVSYWLNSAGDMSRRFPGSRPALIWLVSTMDRVKKIPGQEVYATRTRLTFPPPANFRRQDENIVFAAEDASESYLQAFDQAGYQVWLQVEPAMADIPTLIDLVMERYHHHPCVIGFGVDVEWHRWSEKDSEGIAVTDEQAREWQQHLRRWNPSYLLFLKHWEQSKLPPTYREGLVFIDDSQIFESLDQIILEFARWARWFYPAPVGFQFGYPADRHWWEKLADPPADIGREIILTAPNVTDLYWVDFTVKDIWPDKK